MFPIITQKCSKKSNELYCTKFESDSLSDRRNCGGYKIEEHFRTNNTKNNVDIIVENCNGVFAAELINSGTMSSDVSSVDLICNSLGGKHFVKISKSDGRLRPVIFKNDCSWLKMIKLSKDVHSHNTIIELNRNGLIRIRIVKEILKNDEIIAWFSEEISMLMSIPFLTPTNIRGKNCYTCHVCNKSFEYPNPLKIHLAKLCDRQSLDFLWIKLHYSLIKTKTVIQHENQIPITTTTPTTTNTTTAAAAVVAFQQTSIKSFNSINNQTFFSHDLLMRSTLATYDRNHQSAFKPITPPTSSHLSNPNNHLFSIVQHSLPSSNHQHHQNHQRSFIAAATSSSSSTSSLIANNVNNSEAEVAALNAAAQIETIVSNMGASKQGHLCIYCGKIYSRKYGLKIHIRTHTGFKPLKCKFCLRPFGDPSNLNKHVRLHLQTGNLTYRCHLCHKTLARRRDLQRHIETKHCLIQIDEIKDGLS